MFLVSAPDVCSAGRGQKRHQAPGTGLTDYFELKYGYGCWELNLGLLQLVLTDVPSLSAPCLFLFFCFETWSPYVDQAGLKFRAVYLPLPPGC